MEDSVNAAAAPQPDIAADGWDAQAYASMRDEIEHWKRRATESDEALERISNDLSPTHMGEPVLPAWTGWACMYPGKLPRLYGAREIAEVNCDRENGGELLYLVAATQPDTAAEAQPVDEREAFTDAMWGAMESTLDRRGFRVGASDLGRDDYEAMWMAARAQLGAVPEYNGWYCGQCGRGVDPSEVTYNEAHTECGRIITNDRPQALTATGGRDELAKLLEIANCPCCDGSGAYYDNMGEVCQCQWCDERSKALAAARPAQEKQNDA